MNDDVARDAFERDRPDSPEPDIFTRSVRDDILVHEDLSLFSVRCETLQPLAGCIRSPASSSNATRQLPGGNASGTFTDLLLLLVAMSIPQCFVKRHRQGDSLEIELANLVHLKTLGLDATNEVLAHEDAVRGRLRGDPCRDVDCAPEVVALVVDHRPGVHAHMGGRKASGADGVDDFQRGAHCVARVTEVEMDSIPEHLHHVTAVVAGDLVDQLGKTE